MLIFLEDISLFSKLHFQETGDTRTHTRKNVLKPLRGIKAPNTHAKLHTHLIRIKHITVQFFFYNIFIILFN